jgi:hypothetical protein
VAAYLSVCYAVHPVIMSRLGIGKWKPAAYMSTRLSDVVAFVDLWGYGLDAPIAHVHDLVSSTAVYPGPSHGLGHILALSRTG